MTNSTEKPLRRKYQHIHALCAMYNTCCIQTPRQGLFSLFIYCKLQEADDSIVNFKKARLTQVVTKTN